ncbi:TPA: hypothetical protein ACH3X3_002272 [Trebouxia sp. C0006]
MYVSPTSTRAPSPTGSQAESFTAGTKGMPAKDGLSDQSVHLIGLMLVTLPPQVLQRHPVPLALALATLVLVVVDHQEIRLHGFLQLSKLTCK